MRMFLMDMNKGGGENPINTPDLRKRPEMISMMPLEMPLGNHLRDSTRSTKCKPISSAHHRALKMNTNKKFKSNCRRESQYGDAEDLEESSGYSSSNPPQFRSIQDLIVPAHSNFLHPREVHHSC